MPRGTRAKVACRGLGGRTLRSNARRKSDSEDLKENVSCGCGSNRISGGQNRSHRNGDREQSTNRHGSCRRVYLRLRRNSRLRCGPGRNDAALLRGATRFGQRGLRRCLPGCTRRIHRWVARHVPHRPIAYGRAAICGVVTGPAKALHASHGRHGRLDGEEHRKRQSNGLEQPFHSLN